MPATCHDYLTDRRRLRFQPEIRGEAHSLLHGYPRHIITLRATILPRIEASHAPQRHQRLIPPLREFRVALLPGHGFLQVSLLDSIGRFAP